MICNCDNLDLNGKDNEKIMRLKYVLNAYKTPEM